MKKENNKEVHFTKEMMDKELKNGSLFLKEEYLDQLPLDWFDCIMFVANQGLDQNREAYVLIMDEDQTSRVFDLIAKEEVKVFIANSKEGRFWNVLFNKHKNEKTNELERIIMGGENLRKFCDKKNIYYKSYITEEGALLSGTQMQWQKQPNEDCRIPCNVA